MIFLSTYDGSGVYKRSVDFEPRNFDLSSMTVQLLFFMKRSLIRSQKINLMAKKSFNKVIKLSAPTFSSDLNCGDGEVENGEWLFPTSGQETDPGGSGSGPSDQPGTRSIQIAASEPGLQLSDGARLLLMHSPGDGSPTLALVHLPQGGICSAVWDPASGLADLVAVGGAENIMVSSAACVGAHVALSTPDGLRYMTYDPSQRGDYRWLGEFPTPPGPVATVTPEALAPYSDSADLFPRLQVDLEVGADHIADLQKWLQGNGAENLSRELRRSVQQTIAEEFDRMLSAINAAGLTLFTRYARTVWGAGDALICGPATEASAPCASNEPGDGIALAIVGSVADGDRLSLTLSVSRRPARISAAVPEVPEVWRGIITDVEVKETGELRDVFSSPCYIGAPQSLSSPDGVSGSRYFNVLPRSEMAVESDREELLRDELPLQPGGADLLTGIECRLLAASRSDSGSRLTIFHNSFPFIAGSYINLPSRVIALAGAVRQRSESAEPPFLAFCADGIRLLEIEGGVAVVKQVISRDVVHSAAGVAATPQGVAFACRAGVYMVSGTSRPELLSAVKSWEALESWEADDSDALECHYESGALLLYNPLTGRARQYSISTGVWTESKLSPVLCVGNWPRLWIVSREGSLVSEAVATVVRDEPTSAPPAAEEHGEVIVTLRPLKLGDPSAWKYLREVQLLWGGGKPRRYEVEGSADMRAWRLLARGRDGHTLSLHGSAWRYYRLRLRLQAPASEEPGAVLSVTRPLIRLAGYISGYRS